MKTAEGAVDYSAPQVRDTPEPFVSACAALSGRTQDLERLAVELYARGLSTRDIEDAFTDETGRRLLSRAAVSEITERLWAEYEDFCKRDLSEHAIVYLFVDGIAERLRPGQRREAVLAAWGIGEDGRKVLLGSDGGLQGGRRDGAGVLPGPARQRASAIRCWSSPTGRRGSSGRSRNAFRARRASAAWRTGCATLRSRSQPICGRSSRRASPPAIRRRRGRSRAQLATGIRADYAARCQARSPASRTTSRRASRTCGCPSPIGASSGRRICSNGCSSRSAGG